MTTNPENLLGFDRAKLGTWTNPYTEFSNDMTQNSFYRCYVCGIVKLNAFVSDGSFKFAGEAFFESSDKNNLDKTVCGQCLWLRASNPP
jgi:hypothetical protein